MRTKLRGSSNVALGLRLPRSRLQLHLPAQASNEEWRSLFGVFSISMILI